MVGRRSRNVNRFRQIFLFCAGALLIAATGQAQANPPASSREAAEPITAYISHTWDTLTRSMSDCHSVVDPKVKTVPVLYLPKELPMPADVVALQSRCRVRVERLPVRIEHLGQIRQSDIPTPGLLYLPHSYVVPGGRFNEMYGWDSYFIILGLVRDGRLDLARDMVDNFSFEIEHYGGILNANRTYYFTRSQPPFFSSMVLAVYNAEAARAETPKEKAELQAWLAHAYADARRDYSLWTSSFHRAGNTGLARYFDLGEGPVPEMADDSTYYTDVIHWLLAHPSQDPGYLVSLPDRPTPAELPRVAALSCNVKLSKVCARAHVDGHWLTRAFYKGDRAMRESGFDPSFRYGPFSGSTQYYAPVGLNSLLYKYAMDMARIAAMLHKPADVPVWKERAVERRAAINRYLWDAKSGMYMDYDYVTHRRSTYVYATMFYPLWAGAASSAQARAVEAHLHLLEHPGGIAMSMDDTGLQWDLPYGWAPVNWIDIDGLHKAGDDVDADRVAHEFSRTIEDSYLKDHTLREKYDVVTGSAHVDITTGYTTNEIGFGWTNAVYLKMQQLLSGAP